MKKVIAIMAVLAIAAPVMAFHGDQAWQDKDYDCATCHIPHTNSNVGTDDMGTPGKEDDISIYGIGNGDLGVPLWSGLDVANEERYGEIANWTMYSSETLNALMPSGPRGSTILCMSCHDRVHKDADPAKSSGYTINSVEGDLSTSHPVDFVYDDALAVADGELVLPSVGDSFLTRGAGPYTIQNDLLFTATGALNGSGVAGKVVNCISCHEIHMNGLHQSTIAGTSDSEDPVPDTAYSHTKMHIPRLQPLDTPVPIGFEVGRGGSATVKEDWELNYGGLCKTCHIK